MARCECSKTDERGNVLVFHVEKDHDTLHTINYGKEVNYLHAGACKVKGCKCQKFKTALDEPRGAFMTSNKIDKT